MGPGNGLTMTAASWVDNKRPVTPKKLGKIGPKIGPKIGTKNTVIFLMIFSNLLLKRVGNTLVG